MSDALGLTHPGRETHEISSTAHVKSVRIISLNYVDVRHVSVECDPNFCLSEGKHISKKTYARKVVHWNRVHICTCTPRR